MEANNVWYCSDITLKFCLGVLTSDIHVVIDQAYSFYFSKYMSCSSMLILYMPNREKTNLSVCC